MGLNTGGIISATYYQPTEGDNPNLLPRFNKEDKINAYSNGLGAEAESWDTSLACLSSIELTGSKALLAGAAMCFSLAALL